VPVKDDRDTYGVDGTMTPDPKLAELSQLLVGTWRVDGPDIGGRAGYHTTRQGSLLVAHVDFKVADSPMTVIQHITHDPDSDTLRARYMDTMGNAATYTWVLDHPTIRVSLGEPDSDTYFQATLNENNSQYAGTWHYAEEEADATEIIVYTRVSPED
jgi:hypothetical protein